MHFMGAEDLGVMRADVLAGDGKLFTRWQPEDLDRNIAVGGRCVPDATALQT